jgi:DNA polymerase (family 10)
MENVEIARALREVADLLEVRGENPFKVRAYRNAARTIEGLTRPLAELVREGADLEELPSIGKDMAGYITELVRTGRLRRLEELERKIPHGVAELMRLEGVGPKKAMTLHRELGIRTIDDLARALDEGEVEKLPGFGKRSAEKLRRAIRDYRRHLERYKLSDAEQLIRPILDYMRGAPGLRELEVAGSYRRRVETIGDVDILAAAAEPKRVVAHFTAYPGARRVESAGTTRATLVLPSGLHVDLRVVPPRSWGAALHYFTGSKAHNIAVRRLGVAKGLRINEYGIFRVRKGKTAGGRERLERIGGATEDEVFRAVGMDPVPPELREARGEVEAARKHALPKLISPDDIRGDLQMHTRWSDGQATVEAMARAAKERGYAYIAITDHSPAVAVAGGIGTAELEKQWREIDAVNRRVKGITVLKGVEVDILADGSLDLPDEFLERLDVVVAAVHSKMGLSKARMTDRIIKGIGHPAVHILAHPTGRIINRREPYAVDIDAVLEAAAELGVAVELNAQPDRLDLSDVHAFRARELGVRIAIDTDAHTVDQLGFMRYGVDQARRAWLGRGDVVNTMDVAGLRKWLARRRR